MTAQQRSFVEGLLRLRPLFQSHPHHLTLESPWPILTSGAVLAMLSSAALWFNGLQYSGTFPILGMLSTITAMILWWADCVKEGTYLGHHTKVVQQNLAMGVALFIVTEAALFVSIFWAYFHSSLAPTVELGTQWPPAGITALSPMAIPLLNTVLLLSSGATVTWGHHAFFCRNRSAALQGLMLTVALAIIFTALQGVEYNMAGFTIADGAYGSCFYMATGAHGLHVLVGTLAITVGLARLINYQLTSTHHIGLEGAILYWHFVDVVWVILYVTVYWWGAP